MSKPILKDWQPHHACLFGKQSLPLQHGLAETGLFTKEALSELIATYPRSHYNINTMGYDHDSPDWREGDISGFDGEDVIDAIDRGRMWLNLRRVMDVDPRYAGLLNDIFSEFERQVPGLQTFKQNIGILISSPKSQVFYHADIPGQSLWQIAGRKRVYVYPAQDPFLPMTSLEDIVLGETEEEIPYESWFDDYAEVYDLEPGQMVHWPLNRPHRVVNEDCLNISVTTEHWTPEIRKSYAVNYGNGVLRRVLGYAPRSRSIEGMAVYPKAAIALFCKALKLRQSRQFVRRVDFRIDPNAPTGISDIPAFELA